MSLAVRDAERVLREMFLRDGLDPGAPSTVEDAWRVFREFAAVASEATGPEQDGVLYQAGNFSFHGVEEFYLDFVRQFEVTDDGGGGEHDHYEQLHCEFRFPMTAETRARGRFAAWWFASGSEPWSAFVSTVEARPEFAALRAARPVGVRVWQDLV